MNNLMRNMQDVTEKMSEIENARELAIRNSRSIIRMTKHMIHSIHVGEPDASEMDRLKLAVADTVSSVKGNPEIFYSGALDDAMMEFAEAAIFCSVADGEPIPSCRDLQIPERAWVLGLADCIGEMRRLLLTYLMNSETEKAKRLFSQMEEISDGIMLLDVPDAIMPMRRKQDIARGIMERTRTDITNALMMSKMDKM